MEHEEDISCDLMTYSEICEDIRRIMTKIGQLKSSTGKADDKKQEITELRMQVGYTSKALFVCSMVLNPCTNSFCHLFLQ